MPRRTAMGFAKRSTHPTISNAANGIRRPIEVRHARPRAGHPRLTCAAARKTWMAWSSPAMTKKRIDSVAKRQPDQQDRFLARRANVPRLPRLISPPNQNYILAVPSHRGATRDRHGRGAGCGGRGCADNERRVIPPSLKLRRTGTKPVEAFGVDGCGRRSRVVLTPRRWRQVRAKERGRRWQESPVAGESTK
jgi:hypothetical protein